MARQQFFNRQNLPSLPNLLWDIWCSASLIGIWPRYIEPQWLQVTSLKFKSPLLPPALDGLKLLQFSDLHIHPKMSNHFLNKIKRKITALSPDLILFTGDFLCRSALNDADRLREWLCQLQAPYGCFAVLGNHDYANPISINSQGEYDVIKEEEAPISKGFSRLFDYPPLAKRATPQAIATGMHEGLIQLLDQTPFQLLHNHTHVLKIGNSGLNLSGLGEYMLGKTDPAKAFQNYEYDLPGVILQHNPDGIPLLANFPGEIILCGHTHGGQVNLPWIGKRLIRLENMAFKSGQKSYLNKWIYINRGVGAILPFRWFSPPELLLLTLERAL